MENENFRRIQISAETTKELREVQQEYETLRRNKETMLAEKALSTKTRENILSSIDSQTNVVSAAVAEVEMEYKHHLDYVSKVSFKCMYVHVCVEKNFTHLASCRPLRSLRTFATSSDSTESRGLLCLSARPRQPRPRARREGGCRYVFAGD